MAQKQIKSNLGAALEEQKKKVEEAAAAPPATQQPKGSSIYDQFRGLLERQKNEISKVLPQHMDTTRLLRIIMTSFRSNPELMECSPASVLGAVMQLAQLGLEPILNLAHLVPYYNKKTGQKECQMLIGYRGYIQLVMNTGEVGLIQLKEVYAGDQFDYEYGLNPNLKHKPASFKDRGEISHFYAIINFNNGLKDFLIMCKEDIDFIRDNYSAGYKFRKESSPWHTDYVAMAKKTILKQMLKYCPISFEILEKLNNDEKVIDFGVETDKLLGIAEPSTIEAQVIE